MANTKEYKIIINGITESVDAVKSLERELTNLEERMKTLESRTFNVRAAGNGGAGGGSAARGNTLTEEAKLEKQILQTEAKREAYSKEIYQNYLASKEALSETVKDQKQLAAAERLSANAYSNTMQGMKQELADIKQVMQTVDLGDHGEFERLTQRANQLNEALKKIEESYGQFGRNVGNYKSAVEGFTVVIGNSTEHFESAKKAARELGNEMKTLQYKKDKGIISEEELQRLKELPPIVAKIQSAIHDAGKPMDALMDSMQSFTAMAQIGKGFSAFFGFDNTEVEKSIQKLVALQNAMQGLQTIQKQMQSEEGIGKIFSTGFQQIDKFTDGLKETAAQSKVATVSIKGLNLALKGLASIGIFAVMTLIAEGIYKVVDALKDWVKGNADLVSSEKLLKQELDITNDALSRKLNLINAQYDAQELTYAQKQAETEKAYAEAIKESNIELEKRLKLNDNNSTFANAYTNSGAASWKKFLEEDTGVTTLGGFTEAAGTMAELRKRYEALSKAVEENTGLVYKNAKGIEICHLTASDAKDEFNHLEQFMAGQLIGAFKQFDIATEKGRKQLQEFVNTMMAEDDNLRKTILLRLPEIVDNNKGNLGDALNNYLTLIKQFANLADAAMKKVNFEKYVNSLLDSVDETGERLKQRQKQELTDRYNALSKEEQKAQEENYKKGLEAIEKQHQKKLSKVTAQGQKLIDKEREIEASIAKARIDGMKEGLNKTITQLEEERKARLAKLTKNMKNYKELEKQINDVYNDRILKATEEWNKKMEKANADMWLNIKKDSLSNSKSIYEGMEKSIEINTLKLNEASNKLFNQGVGSYGVQGKNQLSDDTRAKLGIISADETTEVIQDFKKLIEIQREYAIAENDYKAIQIKNMDELEAADKNLLQVRIETSEKLKKLEWDRAFMWDEEYEKVRYNIVKILDQEELRVQKLRELKNQEVENAKRYAEGMEKTYDEYKASLKQKYDTESEQLLAKATYDLLIEENYSKDLKTVFNQRLSVTEAYWSARIMDEKRQLEVLYNQQKEIIDKEYEIEKAENENHWDELQKTSDKAYQEERDGIKAQVKYKIISAEEGNKQLEALEVKYKTREAEITQNFLDEIKNIEKKHTQDIEKLNLERNEKLQDTNREYYENRLQDLRDFQTAISNLQSKQPVKDDWGITNQKETQKNFKNLKTAYESFAAELAKVRTKIKKEFDDGLIDKDVFESTLRETENMSQGIGEALDELSYKMSNWGKTQTFFQDMQQYFQEVVSSFNQVMQAIWSAQDTQMDKEAEALDEANKIIQDKLDKQQEIVEQHKSKIDSIEDELSTARGDRRQHLIDQLNAEMAAQREAQAQEKKIQKEKEANERKQDELEKKRKKQQYQRDMMQAVVNGAMAVTYALVNKWPIPALPMAALAASTAAAQIGIMAANKPYAKGGLLEGPSHAQGGIPVGNTGIEVEGKEYVIRKSSTAPNIEILDYINKSQRKLDLDDFIEFYSSGKMRKTITQISPKSRFADGGTIPTLSNSIDINDRLLDAFEDYSNRPVYVSVQDINSRQKAVKDVQVLAGLTE